MSAVRHGAFIKMYSKNRTGYRSFKQKLIKKELVNVASLNIII